MNRYSATTSEAAEVKKREMGVTQEWLPQIFKDGGYFDIPQWTICGNVRWLEMRNLAPDEDLEQGTCAGAASEGTAPVCFRRNDTDGVR